MKLIALYLVRNEDWCVGFSLRVLLRSCDAVVVLEHLCTDRTHEIVCQCADEVASGRVIVAADDHEEWQEMRLRNEMLKIARQHGATHIWLGDADEVASRNLLDSPTSSLRCMVECIPVGHILTLPLYNLRGGITRYHANGIWGSRITSVAFKDEPNLGWPGDTFHSREPRDLRSHRPTLKLWQPVKQGQGGILHLWGASERRLIAKHRAYRIAENLRWPEKSAREIEAMYSQATEGRPQHGDVPASWTYADVSPAWLDYPDLMNYLDVNAVPWQEVWIDEMVAKHGRERFAGLKV